MRRAWWVFDPGRTTHRIPRDKPRETENSPPFLDCGGKLRGSATRQLQIRVGADHEHRIETVKMAAILNKAESLFADESIPAYLPYRNSARPARLAQSWGGLERHKPLQENIHNGLEQLRRSCRDRPGW